MHLRTGLLSFTLLAVALAAQSTICHSRANNTTFANNVSMGGPNLWVGIKLQTTAQPLVATRAEMWTGEQAGTNSIWLFSHDAAGNKPLQNLGGGSWAMSRINGWQGATFPAPVLITPNTTFWLVWAPINGAQSSIEIGNLPGPEYRGSFDQGQNWNGPFSMQDWKYRIFCGGRPGHYEVYGAGCLGATRRRPELGFADVPTLGQNTVISLASGTPSGNAFLSLGASDTNWGALALPFDLTPFGASTCSVLASLDFSITTPIDVTGQA